MAEEESELRAALSEAIELLEELRSAAVTYVGGRQGWSEQLGLYFHVFGHNSVTLENGKSEVIIVFLDCSLGWGWLRRDDWWKMLMAASCKMF